jgi:hypothetical protein
MKSCLYLAALVSKASKGSKFQNREACENRTGMPSAQTF